MSKAAKIACDPEKAGVNSQRLLGFHNLHYVDKSLQNISSAIFCYCAQI